MSDLKTNVILIIRSDRYVDVNSAPTCLSKLKVWSRLDEHVLR